MGQGKKGTVRRVGQGRELEMGTRKVGKGKDYKVMPEHSQTACMSGRQIMDCVLCHQQSMTCDPRFT